MKFPVAVISGNPRERTVVRGVGWFISFGVGDGLWDTFSGHFERNIYFTYQVMVGPSVPGR